MTSPCLNCHNSPATDPYSQENEIYREKPPRRFPFSPPLPVIIGPINTDCSAQNFWLPGLEVNYPEMQNLPFWVRNNFEKTLAAYRQQAKGKLALPFRIDLRKAKLEMDLHPRHFVVIGRNDTFRLPLHVRAGDKAFIRSQLMVEENEIPIGLRSLLEFHQVWVTAVGPYVEYAPQKVGIDSLGLLHLLGKPNGGMKQVFSHFDFDPRPSVPYPAEGDCAILGPFKPECTVRDTYEDLILNRFLPNDLLIGYFGGLPNQFSLEDLILRIINLPKTPTDPKSPPFFRLADFFSPYFLKPGSRITLSLEDLRDFFLPGVLDLGPTHGVLSITVDADHNLVAELKDFSINLEPMDYMTREPGARGSIQLEFGTISPGPPEEKLLEAPIAPGLRVLHRTPTGEMDIEGNLRIAAGIKFPWIGRLLIYADLIAHAELLRSPEGYLGGYELSPKTGLKLKNVRILNEKNEPILTEGEWDLASDTLQARPWENRWGLINLEPTAFLSISGKRGNEDRFECQASSPIPLKENGPYDLLRLKERLNLASQFQYTTKDGDQFSAVLTGVPDFKTLPLAAENEFAFLLELKAEHQLPKQKEPKPLLDNGRLRLFRLHPSPEQDVAGLRFDAQRFEWPKFLLNGIEADVEVDVGKSRFSEDSWKVAFRRLSAEANNRGSRHGYLQGPIRIRQVKEKELVVEFRLPSLRFSVEKLDLELSAQQIAILTEEALKLFDPSIRSIGLDGHLMADFIMSFKGDPKIWHGEGDIRLQGDKNGDLYLLNAQGQRSGEPFIRNTRWSFKRINRINTSRGYTLGNIGDYQLETWINLDSLASIAKRGQARAPVDEVEKLTGQRPHELRWRMFHNNMPWSSRGFKNRIEDYIIEICHEVDWCKELARGARQEGGKKP